MPPLYPAMLGVYQFTDPPEFSGVGDVQSCAAVPSIGEVRVTQLAAEVMVPFTEGNVTSAGVKTVRVGTGNGNRAYLVAPIVDSGDELRGKVVKDARVTGKLTNGALRVYGYDVGVPIVASDLENGVNSSTRSLPLPHTTNVAQSALVKLNVKNAVLHTVRIEVDDRGEATRDRIDEIVYQVARQGVRR
jgi:hypothetical protein